MPNNPDGGDVTGDDLAVVRALLAATNPVPDTPLTETERRRGEQMLAVLLDDSRVPSSHSGQTTSRWARVLRREVLAAAATILVIAGVLVGITTVRTGDRAVAAPLLPTPLLTAPWATISVPPQLCRGQRTGSGRHRSPGPDRCSTPAARPTGSTSRSPHTGRRPQPAR